MKTVLLFTTALPFSNRPEHLDVLAYAKTHDWKVQHIEYLNSSITRYWEKSSRKPNIKELISLWHPNGCIVECGGFPTEDWHDDFRDVPTVFTDRPSVRHRPNVVCISSDSKAIALSAAKELLSSGAESFAYVAHHEALPWNEDRGKWFQKAIESHGKRCRIFQTTDRSTAQTAKLAQELANLPKPCGIFAANDVIARMVATAAEASGFPIPEEVAIVGVDNDQTICEQPPHTLTSIEQDYDGLGLLSARVLDRLMAGERGIPDQTFGIKRIVHRLSSNGLIITDKRVRTAVEHIRLHACEGIGARDVIAMMDCSERLANLRFSEARHHTILDEIHLQRIEVAKEQLSANVNSIETIAGLCGYASPNDFSRVFKRYTGATPRSWRRLKGVVI